MAQQQSKAHSEAMHKPASRTPSMPSAGLPNSALLSWLGNTDAPTSQPNKTGLPDALKARFERLTGMPLDDVRVHRNSDKPAELGALAYAQGNEIFLRPGQEKHLEHELGHVVQQKQGIVRPTNTERGQAVNDDPRLENQSQYIHKLKRVKRQSNISVIQKVKFKIKDGLRQHVDQVRNRLVVLPQPQRHTTTFHYVTTRNQQGPHIIPVAMRAVFLYALRKSRLDPLKFIKSRLLPRPRAAEKKTGKFLRHAHGISKAEKEKRVSAYSMAYKRVFHRLMTASTLDARLDEFEKLTDLSPTQTYALGVLPTKQQIQGKGETQPKSASDLLSASQPVLLDTPGAFPLGERKGKRVFRQMRKVVKTRANEDVELSDDSDEEP